MHDVLPHRGDVAPARSVRSEQDQPLAAGAQWALRVLPEVGQRAEVGGNAGPQLRGNDGCIQGVRRLVGPDDDDLAPPVATGGPGRVHRQRDRLQAGLGCVSAALGDQPVDEVAELAPLVRQPVERRLVHRRLPVRHEVAECDDADPEFVDVLALRGEVALHVVVEAQRVGLHRVDDRIHAPGDVDAEHDVDGVAQAARDRRGEAGLLGGFRQRLGSRLAGPAAVVGRGRRRLRGSGSRRIGRACPCGVRHGAVCVRARCSRHLVLHG